MRDPTAIALHLTAREVHDKSDSRSSEATHGMLDRGVGIAAHVLEPRPCCLQYAVKHVRPWVTRIHGHNWMDGPVNVKSCP